MKNNVYNSVFIRKINNVITSDTCSKANFITTLEIKNYGLRYMRKFVFKGTILRKYSKARVYFCVLRIETSSEADIYKSHETKD